MIEVGKKYRVHAGYEVTLMAYEKISHMDQVPCLVTNGSMEWYVSEKELLPLAVPTPIRLTNNAPIPFYATEGAAGFDIAANETVTINPGHWVPVATGLHIQLPIDQELQIRSRSGIAKKDGLVVHQGIGTIDSDYRGEIFVMLRNTGLSARTVNRGDRIAQGVIAPVIRVEFEVVDKLDDTVRGEAGFGSSGR